MIRRTSLRFTRVSRIAALALPVSLAAQPAAPTPPATEPETVEMESVSVVGSRLESTDRNTPSPVMRIDRADLDATGYGTLGDLVRNLPFNSGNTIGMEGGSTGFSPGVSAINLRGLGNNNTLVLINGRRSSPAGGSAFNGFQTVFDFNSVPAALVESVEILKDAGSGIYGSDAVAGVVAINLVKTFDGTQLNFAVGNSTEISSPMVSAGLIHGWSDARQSVFVEVDARRQDGAKYRDRPFSASGDQRARGGSDLRSPTSFPARVSLGGTFYTQPAPTRAPQIDLPVTTASPALYDFNQVEDMFPDVENRGVYARWTRTDGAVNPFAEFSFRQNLTEYEAAPVALRNTFEQGDGPGGVLQVPSANPYNPWGDATFAFDLFEDFRWRMTELGNRVFDNRSTYTRALAGLAGQRPEKKLRWEAAVLYARSDASFTTHNLTSDALVQKALNGTLPGLAGKFANIFGPSDAGVIDAIRISNTNKSTFSTLSADAFVTGRARELRHGPLRYAIGTELRREALDDRKSALSAAGQIVGGSEGAPFDASREVYALFAEAAVPLLKTVELRGAARFEYYSDFGDTTKPKLSLSWRPTEHLLFRASYGGAFLAPNLPFLYTPRITTFSSGLLPDPKRNNELTQVQIRTGGDPDLQPEETAVTSAGFVWRARPDDLGLKLEGSWFEFRQTDLLNSLGADFLLANEDLFPGRVVRSAPPAGSPPGTAGPIQYVSTYYENVDRKTYRGYDLDLAYAVEFAALGRFRASVSATFIDTLKLLENEFAGAYGNAQWRGGAGLSWSKRDWSASTYVSYIGSYRQQFVASDVSSDTRVNLTLSHANVLGWQVTLGVRNLFNVEPPMDLSRAEGYNLNVNSGESRFVTLSLAKRF